MSHQDGWYLLISETNRSLFRNYSVREGFDFDNAKVYAVIIR